MKLYRAKEAGKAWEGDIYQHLGMQNITSDNCLTNQHPLITETLAMLLILRQVWQPGCRGRAGRLAAKRATRVPGRRQGPGSDYAAASHFLAKTSVWGLPQMLELVTTCPNVKMVIINMVVNLSHSSSQGSLSSEVQHKQGNGRATFRPFGAGRKYAD